MNCKRPFGAAPGLAGLLACALLTAPAWAQTPTPKHTASAPSAFDGPAVDSTRLESHRGGDMRVHSDMQLSGTTADNSAHQVTTGNNAISTGSFANMSGLPVVVQNTGANVLIQNAVILNVQMN